MPLTPGSQTGSDQGPPRGPRCHNEVASPVDERARDVEKAVVVPYRRCKNPARDSQAVQIELFRPVHDVTDVVPVHKVTAVENRDSGKVRKRRVHDVVVVTHPANARIGIEPGKHGFDDRLTPRRESGTEEGDTRYDGEQKCLHMGYRINTIFMTLVLLPD